VDSLFCVSAILGNPPTLSEPPQHEKKIHEHKGILRQTTASFTCSSSSSSSSSSCTSSRRTQFSFQATIKKRAMNNEAPIIVKTTEEMETELPSATFIKERRILVPIDISSYHHSKVSTEFVLKHLIKPKESIIHFLTIIPRKEVSVYSSSGASQNASHCKAAELLIEKWFKSMCEGKKVAFTIEAVELAKMSNRTISSIICERCLRFSGQVYTLIALAAHNKSAIAEFFLGSVCKSVVSNACIPVCVVNTAPQSV